MNSIALLAILLLVVVPAHTSYSPAIALEMGYLAAASYENASSIEAWTCSPCRKYALSEPKVFSNSIGGIQGFTGYSHGLNAIVVVFRGSSNIQNWILNIGTTRSTFPLCSGCSVHTGFYDGYKLVSSAVKTAVQNLKAKYRGAKLVVTGHSLGGSLAILCAAELKTIFGTVDLTYTFGQPRVGNQAFADWFQKQNPTTYRLVDYADIVTHVPPANFGFVHSSQQIWYQRGMQSYVICTPQSPNCANSIPTTSFSTDDHSLDNYLKLKVSLFNIPSVYEVAAKKGLRSEEKGLKKVEQQQQWKDEEEKKVNEVLSNLGVKYFFQN